MRWEKSIVLKTGLVPARIDVNDNHSRRGIATQDDILPPVVSGARLSSSIFRCRLLLSLARLCIIGTGIDKSFALARDRRPTLPQNEYSLPLAFVDEPTRLPQSILQDEPCPSGRFGALRCSDRFCASGLV